MTNSTSIPRLRSIKFKNGGSLTSIDGVEGPRRIVMRDINQVMDNHGHDIAGFAFVVWDKHGASTVATDSSEASIIPSIMVPDFCRARLLAQRIESWSIQDFWATLGENL